jgi:ABC-2 type transport system permease protein
VGAGRAGLKTREVGLNLLLPAGTLWWREVVRFLRQRNRIVGALGTPLVFWLIIGSGLGSSFRSSTLGGEHYLEYSFPGTLALILLFTSIFSTISIIEDRQAGFLQSVLVAPVSRGAITLGKILGGTTLALLQALLFLLLAPLVGIGLSIVKFLTLAAVLFVVGFALTAVGFLIAWRMDSTQGFHAIMNLLLIPMWLLSGSFFPASGAPAWIRVLIHANPLTYGVGAIRRILYMGQGQASMDIPSLGTCLAISIGFGLAAFGATTFVAARTGSR